jgi:hypothetical protein
MQQTQTQVLDKTWTSMDNVEKKFVTESRNAT